MTLGVHRLASRGPGHIVLGGNPTSPPQRGTAPYCSQTAGWIKMALGMAVGLAPSHIALDGDSVLLQRREQSPQSPARVYCGQTAGWIKMALGIEVDLGSGHIVLDVDPAPPKRGEGTAPPAISAHVYCGQTAGWIKLPIITEVGVSPGDIVLDRTQIPLPKGAQSPSFQPMSIVLHMWPKGWMDEHASWYGSRPRHRPDCIRRGPSCPRKGHSSPLFLPCLLWRRSPISATAELLF